MKRIIKDSTSPHYEQCLDKTTPFKQRIFKMSLLGMSILLASSPTFAERVIQTTGSGQGLKTDDAVANDLGFNIWHWGNPTITKNHQERAMTTHAIAIGSNARALAAGSVVIGGESTATSNGANNIANINPNQGGHVLIGQGTYINGNNHVAIGANSYVNGGEGGLSIGRESVVYKNAVAIGNTTTATGTSSVALGQSSTSTGLASFALGSSTNSGIFYSSSGANASGDYAYSIGSQSKSSGANSLAIGRSTVASSVSSIALGNDATSTATSSIALGTTAISSGTNALALGADTSSTANNSVAIGHSAQASQNNATSIGFNAIASASNSTALGQSATAKNTNATAAGVNSLATGSNSFAIGSSAQALNSNSLSLGDEAYSSGTNSVAIGKSSLATSIGSLALGANTVSNALGSIALGQSSQATKAGATALGSSSLANGLDSLAIGSSAKATNNNTLALGDNSQASGTNSVAVGESSKATANNALALGSDTTASASNAIAMGVASTASNTNAMALGNNALANSSSGIALGQSSQATATNSVALGQNATSSKANSVALGSGATTALNATKVESASLKGITFGTFAGQVSNTNMQVSLGETNEERQLKSVGSGSISATSTDAINGSQLYATNNALGNMAQSLEDIIGGSTILNPDGSISTENLGNTGKNTIHEAIAAAKTKVSQGKNIKVTQTINADGSSTYEVATLDEVDFNVVNIGPVIINQEGINAGDTKIINVSEGEVSPTSKDAVNGSQLYNVGDTIYNIIGAGADFNAGRGPTFFVAGDSYYTVGDAIHALDREDKRLQQAINDAADKAYAGIAAAMALESAPYIAGKWTYSVGTAHFASETAFGATLRKTADNGRWSMTIGVAGATEGDASIRFGISAITNL